jgi:hypothetical protein
VCVCVCDDDDDDDDDDAVRYRVSSLWPPLDLATSAAKCQRAASYSTMYEHAQRTRMGTTSMRKGRLHDQV